MLSGLTKLQVRSQNPERGATGVEYGLMVALIAVVIIVAIKLLGTNLSSLFNKTAANV
jgi:pilus assembly protein Flp/PilA